MTTRKFIDNAPTATVVGAITSGQTSFTVSSLAGFPASFPYPVTLGLGTASAEQIDVTGAVGTTVTVTRNANGQGAFSHPDAETFDHTATARDYTEANTHVNATSGVHGLTGAVVGTTDTQTLTNKTATTPSAGDNSTKLATTAYVDNKPLLQVYQTSGQSIPNNTFTPVTFNNSVVDTHNGHSNTVNPSRYTAQVAGYHRVAGQTNSTSNATGTRQNLIWVNGSAASPQMNNIVSAAVANVVQVVGVVHLNVGDYVEIAHAQTSGGALTLQTTGCWMTAEYIRP